MNLTSSAFREGQPIPRRHSGEAEDLSPPLSWSEAPAPTREFAVVCDDPDAPTPQPWVHWVIYKIPAACVGLPEGVPRVENPRNPAGALQGRNSWPNKNIGYRGPMPPPGHGVHHYCFRLYALDAVLTLPPGADRETLLRTIKGHVLAEARLTGTYERK
jgi:Raf kinase inhibitor-like YbhB/YbcL family protein